MWVIPLMVALCVSLTCLALFVYNLLPDDSQPMTEDDSWARVQQAGVLRVATSADYPPFSYYNDAFIIDGFDPALIRDIGMILGLDVEVTDYAFDGLDAVLQIGQADVVIDTDCTLGELKENVVELWQGLSSP